MKQSKKLFHKAISMVLLTTLIVTGFPIEKAGAAVNSKQSSKTIQSVKTAATPTATPKPTATPVPTMAPAVPSGDVDLRFIFTTDLHGRVNSQAYDTGGVNANKGLSKIYSLIQTARGELPAENSYTFDVGDVLYDPTTDYIFKQDDEAIQPIYQAMSIIKYDAITLGNHDFDYGYNYLLTQLKGSGMYDKVVLTNVMKSLTGEHPFKRNRIITREVKTSNGDIVTVKIGIIGETVPALASKTESYTGVLKTEDIVQNVRKEAALLKQQGVDLVVVLSHSGFGEAVPEEKAINASYALTLIDDVDVVLAGHEHHDFPGNKDLYYYKLPGVDSETGLVNGKLMAMATSQAAGIGVADLTLTLKEDGKTFEIKKQSAQVRKISDYTKVEENEIIKNLFNDWQLDFEEYRDTILAELEDGFEINNYFGLIEDTTAMQLQNDAQKAFAMKYIARSATKYLGYPIITASNYYSYGKNSDDDYVSITGKITQADLAILQGQRNYTSLYTITGGQLKEWMEWSASAYTQLGKNNLYADPTMQDIVQKTGMQPLISEEWMKDWNNFYVFDGVEYVIDPSVAPRYDILGNKINSTRRISSLTYQGKDVPDDMVFVLASKQVASTMPKSIFSWISSQLIYSRDQTQVIVTDYLKSLGKGGKITITPDHNWSVKLPESYNYLLKATTMGAEAAVQSSWYVKKAGNSYSADYYVAKGVSEKDRIQVIASPATNDPVRNNMPIFADAFSTAPIKSLKYFAGDIEADSREWQMAREIVDNKFTVYFNGTFTIYAEDVNGNKAIHKLVIDSIGSEDMALPTVRKTKFNNRSTYIMGTSEPDTMIIVETPNKTYKQRVNSRGTYSCTVALQKAGTIVYVQAVDEATGRASEKVKVAVRRAAPNQPTVNKYYNNNVFLSGNFNDQEATMMVFLEETKTVYVAKNKGKEIFDLSTDIKDKDYKVVEINEVVDADGNFQFYLPPLAKNTKLTVYSSDNVGHLSKPVTVTVVSGGPEVPELYEITNIEQKLSGSIDGVSAAGDYTAYAAVNGKTYKSVCDKDGQISFDFSKNLPIGTEIQVYIESKSKKKSRTVSIFVSDINSIVSYGTIAVNHVEEASEVIEIFSGEKEKLYLSLPKADGTRELITFTTDSYGTYTYNLSEPLPGGMKLYVMSRIDNGSIDDIVSVEIGYSIPTKPKLAEVLTNSTQTVKIVTDKNSRLYLTADGETYSSETGKYSAKDNAYVHSIKLKARLATGTKISFYAQNPSRTGEVVTATVQKKAPNSPKVNTIASGTTTITGTVELFIEGRKEGITVKNSGTQVFIKVGNVTYEATIADDGTFEVTVPTIWLSSKIKVWASNLSGIGPAKDVPVIEKKEPEVTKIPEEPNSTDTSKKDKK